MINLTINVYFVYMIKIRILVNSFFYPHNDIRYKNEHQLKIYMFYYLLIIISIFFNNNIFYLSSVAVLVRDDEIRIKKKYILISTFSIFSQNANLYLHQLWFYPLKAYRKV